MITMILYALLFNTTLKKLYTNYYRFSDTRAKNMGSMLGINTSLTKICVNGSKFSHD